jgi:hypothetical protein
MPILADKQAKYELAPAFAAQARKLASKATGKLVKSPSRLALAPAFAAQAANNARTRDGARA